ncbi:MAG: type I-U CRISPR-associated protein Csb2 [Thermoplasmata archaeon]
MFTVMIELLTGRYSATTDPAREAGEWPPHPARFHLALVATLHESLGTPEERALVEWIEQLGPPALSFHEDYREGHKNEYFVLTNDGVGVDVVGNRMKAPRHFGSTLPREPRFSFIWVDAAPTAGQLSAAKSLFRRVSYLGRSSSLVSVRVTDSAVPTHSPTSEGNLHLRVASPGLMARAEELYTALRSPRPAPAVSSSRGGHRSPRPTLDWQRFITYPTDRLRYGRVHRPDTDSATPPGAWEPPILFRRTGGVHLPVESSPLVTQSLRSLVLNTARGEGVAGSALEILSGHEGSGKPSPRPHVAYFSLPNVGTLDRNLGADGHLLGAALCLPRGSSDGLDSVHRVVARLGGSFSLDFGENGSWSLSRVLPGDDTGPLGTREWRWVGGARGRRSWATVTPVLLDRYPRHLFSAETQDYVAQSCEYAGLPRPRTIELLSTSRFRGAAPWSQYRLTVRRPALHVALEFGEPVRGPVLVGWGRHKGMGLFGWLEDEWT